MKDKTTPKPAMKDFYRHLDECRQCREHPFNLCGVGSLLMQLAIRNSPVESLPHA